MMFWYFFVMLLSNVGIKSVYAALSKTYPTFRKRKPFSKLPFEGLCQLFFWDGVFFPERGFSGTFRSSSMSKACFFSWSLRTYFAPENFAQPRQCCHAGQYCSGRTSWRRDRSNEWLWHWKRKWFEDLGVGGNETHSIHGTGILTYIYHTNQLGVSKNRGTPKSSILEYPYFWKHPAKCRWYWATPRYTTTTL